MTLPVNQIVQGDALAVMKDWPDQCIDLIVTDPPYGVGIPYASYDDSVDAWTALMAVAMPQMLRIARMVVVPSCQIKLLPWWYRNFPPGWLIAWYKGSPGHASAIGFNDWEPIMVYGRPCRPMHDYFQCRCGFELDWHPCPKPLAWSTWLCQRASGPGDIILDPFCGSGTTCVAAKKLGRKYIGIEIDPVYAEKARARLASTPEPLFVEQPQETQAQLFGEQP